MKKFLKAVKDGAVKGVRTGIFLLKIMIPIYVVVVFIKHSFLMEFLEKLFTPIMGIFKLQGDAAVPFIAGVFTDEYGAVAAMKGFDYTMAQITTLAMIVLTFHSIPVESAIAAKIGFPALKFALFRLISAVLIGILIGFLGGMFL